MSCTRGVKIESTCTVVVHNMPLLDFNRHLQLPAKRTNLRLMLWAGDSVHHGVSDVARLPGYDMYICLGLNNEGIDRNMRDLSLEQTICLIDVYKSKHMEQFCQHFQGAFSFINSDYHGNTPKLPFEVYLRLLTPGGMARNTEGINGLIMPEDEILNRLEILAPILPYELQLRRRWAKVIVDLGVRDEISPGEVWSSPDLKHEYYSYAREAQQRFEDWQKERNPAWPRHESTLEAHWKTLSLNTFLVSFERGEPEISALLDRAAFDRFLCSKIPAQFHNGDIPFKQKVLSMVLTDLPAGLRPEIGPYEDERRGGIMDFGLTLVKN